MTVFLTLDQVIEIHDRIEPGRAVIAFDDLLSAIGRPTASWRGGYLHSSVLMQGAAFLDGLLQAHGFEDGNKRTAWIATVTFLEVNGITLRDIPQNIASEFVEDVAKHKYELREIATWLAAFDTQNMRPLGT